MTDQKDTFNVCLYPCYKFDKSVFLIQNFSKKKSQKRKGNGMSATFGLSCLIHWISSIKQSDTKSLFVIEA